MSEGQEPTATTPATGQEPEATPTTPANTGDGQQQEPQTFDREYVEGLRRESAGYRTRAQEAEQRAQEFEDREKTEQQKLAERAEAAEKTAAENAQALMRYEVAAAKGLEPRLVELITGSTREEMEAKADLLLDVAKPKVDPSTFDGGVRATSTDPAGLTPEQQHRETLKQIFGVPSQ